MAKNKFLYLMMLLLITSVFYGQKNGIAYQAVIFKPDVKDLPGVSHSSTPLVNSEICLRFTFLDIVEKTEYWKKRSN